MMSREAHLIRSYACPPVFFPESFAARSTGLRAPILHDRDGRTARFDPPRPPGREPPVRIARAVPARRSVVNAGHADEDGPLRGKSTRGLCEDARSSVTAWRNTPRHG